jgi:hypothetical protein
VQLVDDPRPVEAAALDDGASRRLAPCELLAASFRRIIVSADLAAIRCGLVDATYCLETAKPVAS